MKKHTFAPPIEIARQCCMLRGMYLPFSLLLSSAISPWSMGFTMGHERYRVSLQGMPGQHKDCCMVMDARGIGKRVPREN